MFNQDFYPTPVEVIELMTKGLTLDGIHVLEPSAGKGDIVRYLQGKGANVIACEKEPELRKILQTYCPIIASDFLQLTAAKVSHVSYIIMNPPFSAEEKHILHAWEIAPDGCKIISLCNYDSIFASSRNTRTKDQTKVNSLVAINGYKQELGPVFANAERATNVNIGLIHLQKPISAQSGFDSDMFDMSEEEFGDMGDGLISYNPVIAAVSKHQNMIRAYDKMIACQVEMSEIWGQNYFSSSREDKCFFIPMRDKRDAEMAKETFLRLVTENSWAWIFEQLNMERFMNERLKKQMNEFVHSQKKVPFTVKNIYKMLEVIQGTHKERMNKVVLDTFEMITGYSSRTVTAHGQWKTNSNYIIGQKFIISVPVSFGVISYNASEKIADMMKAMLYTSGEVYSKDKHSFHYHYNRSELHQIDEGGWVTNYPFFKYKLFENRGSLHIWFKPEYQYLLDNFNRKVAELKGFGLPDESTTTKKERKAGRKKA